MNDANFSLYVLNQHISGYLEEYYRKPGQLNFEIKKNREFLITYLANYLCELTHHQKLISTKKKRDKVITEITSALNLLFEEIINSVRLSILSKKTMRFVDEDKFLNIERLNGALFLLKQLSNNSLFLYEINWDKVLEEASELSYITDEHIAAKISKRIRTKWKVNDLHPESKKL